MLWKVHKNVIVITINTLTAIAGKINHTENKSVGKIEENSLTLWLAVKTVKKSRY